MRRLIPRGGVLAVLMVTVVVVAGRAGAQPVAFDPLPYAGVYEGTWKNRTTGAEGATRMEIGVDEAAGMVSVTLDFDGPYLGLIDPPATTLTGTYNEAGARLRGVDPLFGEYLVVIAPDGRIVGLMVPPVNPMIVGLFYTARLTTTTLDADYTVWFADGSESLSILHLERVAGP